MNSNLIEFDGKTYFVDVARFFEIVTGMGGVDKTSDQTINQTYGYPASAFDKGNVNEDDFILVSKEVSESKTNFNDSVCNIKYNFLQNIFQLVTAPSVNMNGEPIVIENASQMHFGQMLAFNTFLELGVIVEINNKE